METPPPALWPLCCGDFTGPEEPASVGRPATKPTHKTQISVRHFILAAAKSFSERVAGNRENQPLDGFQRVCFYLRDFEPSVQGVKMTLTFPFVAAAFRRVSASPLPTCFRSRREA